jgi:mannitol 2-dehydrogenase
MAQPALQAFFNKVQLDEIAPHVGSVPGMTAQAYVELIERRFGNPLIRDTTRRIAFDGSSRHPGFVLPSVRDGLAAHAPVAGLALAEALWARMCEGTREDGSTIEPNDPFWDDLLPIARTARERPQAWLEQRHIYGSLIDAENFVETFEGWLRMIWTDGCQATLRHYTSQEV